MRTCRGTVLWYVENKVPLALKRSVAAHRFLNKICFNEGYLSGPKVCRSDLETPCIIVGLGPYSIVYYEVVSVFSYTFLFRKRSENRNE